MKLKTSRLHRKSLDPIQDRELALLLRENRPVAPEGDPKIQDEIWQRIENENKPSLIQTYFKPFMLTFASLALVVTAYFLFHHTSENANLNMAEASVVVDEAMGLDFIEGEDFYEISELVSLFE